MPVPSHDEVVELSARWYRSYLEYQKTMGELGPLARSALDALIETIDTALQRRTQVRAGEIPFSKTSMSGLPEADWMRFLNDFTLGFGSDQAPVIVVGTEEAYEAGSENLAGWNCCCAVLWLCGSRQDVLAKVAGREFASRPGEGRRPYHLHANDYHHVELGRGRHTWECVAQVVAGDAAPRSLLDGSGAQSLGDLCYQVEVSAYPAQSSIAGRSPTPDRYRFLRKLIASLSPQARVLIFHGRAGDPRWGWRRALGRVFLSADEDGAPGLRQAPETEDPLLYSEDDAGRTVLFTHALSGPIRTEYLEAVAERVRAAIGSGGPRDLGKHAARATE